MAGRTLFPQIPGILLAIPYGALADHIGRKPVLLLGMFGCILRLVWIRIVCWSSPALPLRAVWLSAFTALIGGGGQTVQSMMWVMIADVCSVKRRTLAFSQLSAAVLIPEIIAVPISASLMEKGSWLPFTIYFFMYIICCVPALWIPETLNQRTLDTHSIIDETTPLRSAERPERNGKYVKERFRTEV